MVDMQGNSGVAGEGIGQCSEQTRPILFFCFRNAKRGLGQDPVILVPRFGLGSDDRFLYHSRVSRQAVCCTANDVFRRSGNIFT
jgi:hypothetical protein